MRQDTTASHKVILALLLLFGYCFCACRDGEIEPVGQYCRYEYKGVYSWGNQINGEFGVGSTGLVVSDTLKLVDVKDIAAVAAQNGLVLTTTGDLYRIITNTTINILYLQRVPTLYKFQYLEDIRRGEVLVMAYDGRLFAVTDGQVVPVFAGFRAKYINGIAVLTTDNNVYTYNIFGGVFHLKLNSTATLGGADISYVTTPDSVDVTIAIILANGTLMTWGLNDEYQLGDGTKINRDEPVQILPKYKFSSVSLGRQFTLALTTTGKVFIMGRIDKTPTMIPVELVVADVMFKSIAAGSQHALLVSTDNVPYAFGNNDSGQLADNTTTSRVIPIPCSTIGEKVNHAFAAIWYSIFVYDNRIVLWNFGTSVPEVPATSALVPMVMNGIVDRVKRVYAAASFTMLLTESNQVYGTGSNDFQQLGDGTKESAFLPTRLNMNSALYGKNVESVFAFDDTAMAIANDGYAYLWGGTAGCLAPIVSGTPTKLPTNSTVISMIYQDVGDSASIILLSDGTMLRCVNGAMLPYKPDGILADKKFVTVSSFEGYGFYGITTDGLLVVFGASQYTKPLLETVVSESRSLVTGVVRKTELFDVQDIVLVTLWAFSRAAGTELIVVCKNGKVYRGQQRWILYLENVDPATATKSILVSNNKNVYAYYDHIHNITLQDEKLKKIISIARTNYGFTGVFAKCSEFFAGEQCELPICFGKNASDPTVCGGHGRCISPNNCTCDGFRGATCEVQVCTQFKVGDHCEDLSILSYLIIALCVVSFLVVLACVLLSLTICALTYRRTIVQQKQAENRLQELLEESLLRADSLAEKVDREWIIPFTELEFVERLSEGSFGVVMKGRYQNADVAIKIIKNFDHNMPEVFEHEVQILRSLRHPNIVLFMGVSINDTKRFIVTELMPGKSLDIMIHKHSKRITNKYHNALTFDRKVDLLLDVIRGMQYLHSLQPAIVHRDLKPSNILLDKHLNTCKICDFGTSKFVSSHTMTSNMGTIAYMAPESLMGQSSGIKSDVYSFGIIMHEVFFEQVPFQQYQLDGIISIATKVVQGERPMVPSEQELGLLSGNEQLYLILMQQCWKELAEERPSFDDIFSVFMRMNS